VILNLSDHAAGSPTRRAEFFVGSVMDHAQIGQLWVRRSDAAVWFAASK
jgi:hypothetical protein